MSQIVYNYPAMLAHAGDMSSYAGTLQGLGADIASEQAALSNAWQGDTGTTYQGWQAQWNQAMGLGCTQNVINLLEFNKNVATATDPWVMCLFTVVLNSSGCPADPWWKESEGYASFQ